VLSGVVLWAIIPALTLGCQGAHGPAQERPSESHIRRLIQRLGSDSLEERNQVAQRLKSTGRPAVPFLKEAAESDDREVAARATHILRVIEIRGRLTERLLTLMPGVEERLARGDDHEWTRVFLEAGTVTFGGEIAERTVREDFMPLAERAFLGVRSDEEEGWVCSVIGERQLHHMTPQLMKLLREGSEDSQGRATQALGDLRVKEAVPDIVRLMKTIEHIAYTSTACYALCRMEKEAVLPSLLPVVKNRESWLRGYAIQVLAELGAKEAVPAIRDRLKDDDSSVLEAAVEALASLGAKEAAGDIAKLLEGEYVHVAVDAAQGLANLQAKEFIPQIAKWLDPRHPPYAQKEIGRALCTLGSPIGIEWWLERASRDDELDLEPLNAARRPDVWKRLKGKRIRSAGETGRKLGEIIAAQLGLKWDASGLGSAEEKPWRPGYTEVQPRGWAVRDLDLALSGVSSEGYEYVLESDRIRLLPRDKALAFWKDWWTREKGK